MPVYCYNCRACETSFEVRHSMSFDGQQCTQCGSDNVFKVPSLLDKKQISGSNKPGKIVKDYIEDAKEEIKKEKKSMKLETL